MCVVHATGFLNESIDCPSTQPNSTRPSIYTRSNGKYCSTNVDTNFSTNLAKFAIPKIRHAWQNGHQHDELRFEWLPIRLKVHQKMNLLITLWTSKFGPKCYPSLCKKKVFQKISAYHSKVASLFRFPPTITSVRISLISRSLAWSLELDCLYPAAQTGI